MQQQSTILMFKIETLLMIIDFIKKLMAFIADIWLNLKAFILKNTNSGKYHTFVIRLSY